MNRTGFGKIWRAFLCAVCVFELFSVVYAFRQRSVLNVLSVLAGLFLLFLPDLAEKYPGIRVSTDLRAAYTVLVISGPVLGNVYSFYHIVPYWDKALHMLSGYIVAALGYAIADYAAKGAGPKYMKCLCAVCVSLAVGALWEIYEYALDVFFRLDMQNDVFLSEIYSYSLGEKVGTIGGIDGISTVTVNGKTLPGYIDIGLTDTMNDLILCLSGSLLLCVFASVSKNKKFSSVTMLG